MQVKIVHFERQPRRVKNTNVNIEIIYTVIKPCKKIFYDQTATLKHSYLNRALNKNKMVSDTYKQVVKWLVS